ncbi:hypothetical protein ACJX0J_034075, partial [Zea mays]
VGMVDGVSENMVTGKGGIIVLSVLLIIILNINLKYENFHEALEDCIHMEFVIFVCIEILWYFDELAKFLMSVVFSLYNHVESL